MKLVRATIRRYRSIEAPTSFEIEPDVTSLVGKNESGKTAVLQSLHKSRPVGGAIFDEGIDYPSHKTRELSSSNKLEVTALTYELDRDDIDAVEAELGVNALASAILTVRTGYRYSEAVWDVEIDEAAVVKHLRGEMELPPSTDALASGAKTVAELVDAFQGMEGPTDSTQAVLALVRGWREQCPSLRAIDLLSPRRPKFVYFGDYDTMPGKVSVPRLIAKRDSQDLTRGEEALLALLSLAGVKLEDFNSPTSHEHLIRRLENASNSISDEVFEYWSQNKNLQVELTVIPQPESGAAVPLDKGPLLQIRVRNLKHRVTVPFDERSRGFVWFFSFLAYFSQQEQEALQPLILLLDEPGLSLHATAQHDLLRFIEERLAPRHQVLFSTHSPFMVDAGSFNRVRTVIDQDPGGTTVSADVLRADGESAFPLHAALGIELTQTLFVGPEVLFVEGPSDVVFLQYLSEQLKEDGREALSDRWVLVPGGGITKLPAFLTLFGANDLTVGVLTDSSASNSRTISELRKAGKLYEGGLVEVGVGVGRSEADVEDLLDRRLYMDLVNTAYAGALAGSTIELSDLAGSNRIVQDVTRIFAERQINGGNFSHWAPAGALLRSRSRAKATRSTLDGAEKLMREINKLLPPPK